MKIYIVSKSREYAEDIKKTLEQNGVKEAVCLISDDFTPKRIIEKASDAEILIIGSGSMNYIPGEVIRGLKNLKFISVLGVGVDFIDLNASKKCGVVISNVKGANAEAVAEHCFGMILDLAKRITEADSDIRNKGENSYVPFLGKEIFGKTLGIIGLGDIGTRVARIAGGFSMKVIGTNKSNKKVPGIEVVPLEMLLKQSDVIAVTIPLTEDTENFLSEKEIYMMKEGVILVSISREKIIDKSAVLTALQEKKIFGYGFDAEILTTIERNDPILKHRRVVITPHTAFNTEEANESYIAMTVENVAAFLNGKPIRRVI